MSPYICYKERRFSKESLLKIKAALIIIEEYTQAGYKLTLRQLYYQFVARDLIPNQVKEYDRLGRLISEARLAGLIDWDAIEDRTRNLEALPWWDDPSEMVATCSRQFRVDRWKRQRYRVEVWIEKEALAGVFEPVCKSLDVPYLCCRGYTSQSEMWGAAQRFRAYVLDGQTPVILHFGDHDPSGIDMTRDIEDRLALFRAGVKVERLALTMDQIDNYNPPPNPAKVTDSRFEGYLLSYGAASWELDALEPQVLAGIVEQRVASLIDTKAWEAADEEVETGRQHLAQVAEAWEKAVKSTNSKKRK